MWILSKKSMANIITCHEDLQRIILLSAKISQVDFSITEGHRSIERQQLLFKEGKSKIDGITKKGKHNEIPSMAFDFCAVVKDKPQLAYDEKHLLYLVGIFTAAGEILLMQKDNKYKVRSGTNWDGDGELFYDQTFWDAPHIELS